MTEPTTKIRSRGKEWVKDSAPNAVIHANAEGQKSVIHADVYQSNIGKCKGIKRS